MKDVVKVESCQDPRVSVALAIADRRKKAESGQSMIEFALMLPLLCVLLVGIVELGRAAAITIGVNNAATAAAEYASQSEADAQNTTQIVQTATEDFNINNSMTVSTTHGCSCDTGTGSSCTAPVQDGTCAGFSCDDGDTIVECVEVDTHASWTPILTYPGVPSSFQANGRAVRRVRR